MDAPWGYYRWSLCVDDGETVTKSINSVSSEVDALNAVIYWYDRRHDNTGGDTLDDIDLDVSVSEDAGGSVFRASIAGGEEKERVFVDMSSLGSSQVDINVTGFDVTADNEGCGQNSMKVWLAYYWEDTARDDANGPGSEILAP